MEFEYSSLKACCECPFYFKCRYIDNIVPIQSAELESVPLAFGSLLHTARENLAKGNDIDDVLRVFDIEYDLLHNAWSQHQYKIGTRTKLAGRCLILAYAHKWAQELTQDKETEIGFTVALNQEFALRGKIDYIQLRSYGSVIVDLKHTSSLIWLPQAKLNFQLIGYAFAYESLTGKRPEYIAVDGIVLPRYNDAKFFPTTKTRTPQLPEDDLAMTLVNTNLCFRESALTDRDYDTWLNWLESTISNVIRYLNDDSWPKHSPWNCYNYRRECEYLPLCHSQTDATAQALRDNLYEVAVWHPYE
jgi:hypothetical protein